MRAKRLPLVHSTCQGFEPLQADRRRIVQLVQMLTTSVTLEMEEHLQFFKHTKSIESMSNQINLDAKTLQTELRAQTRARTHLGYASASE